MKEAHKTTNCHSLAEKVLLAVRSVLGPSDIMVPLHEPDFSGNEWTYVKQCIDTGWVSSVGSFVDRFERDLQEFTGAKFAIATANGTSALHICMLLAGVAPGDEVLVPSLTFVATANAVAYSGATPHFVDSDECSLGIDVEKLEHHLSDIAHVAAGECFNRKTGARLRALVAMHTFGHATELDALEDLCNRWHIKLVEDAAESLGSSYNGRHTGNVGLASAISFNGNKVITTGGGGAILTNDEDLGRRAKHLTTTARIPHRWNFIHDEVGFNYRLPNLNAALGCAQLERLPHMLAEKRLVAAKYEEAFRGLSGIRFLKERDKCKSNYWLNTLILDRGQEGSLDAVLHRLNESNYMSRPIWTPMHQLAMYQNCPRSDLSVADSLALRVINIPSSSILANRA
jgi:perosamine synthetase